MQKEIIKAWMDHPVSKALIEELVDKRKTTEELLLVSKIGADREREVLIAVINTIDCILKLDEFLEDYE